MAIGGMFGARKTYDTPLSPQQEATFQAWRSGLPHDLQNTTDYDLRGAYLANAQEAGNGHLPDTWKKPNHYTFSDGSQYSQPGTMGGHWSDATPEQQDERLKRWVFWATQGNLQQHSAPDLTSYFNQYEPNSTAVLPINYSLPQRQ